MARTQKEIIQAAQAIVRENERVWDTRLEHVLVFCLEMEELSPKKAGLTLNDWRSLSNASLSKYLRKYVSDYYREREGTIELKEAITKPDPAVDAVLEAFGRIDRSSLPTISQHHRISMAAENLIGKLLERYIAANLEPLGWLWCCGETAKSIDFINDSQQPYQLLQIKNRDNSENSSSAAIRVGTAIKKWYRISSRTGQTRWQKFPEQGLHQLSEDGFIRFIAQIVPSVDITFTKP